MTTGTMVVLAMGSGAHAALAQTVPPNQQSTTNITFSVTVGALNLNCDPTLDLGEHAPGDTISGPIACEVQDNRAGAAGTTWAVEAAVPGDFHNLDVSTGAVIPASAAHYDIQNQVTTGTITLVPTPSQLEVTPVTVLSATVTGNNTATWDALISIDIPASAVGGDYAGVLEQSVS
jgi:hypothetical protein